MNVEQLHQLCAAYEELVSYMDTNIDLEIIESALELGQRLRQAIIDAEGYTA